MFRKVFGFALVLMLSAQNAALACGPFFDEPEFTYTLHPDLPLNKYAAGNIGVLQPSMARSYLVVAWRYLNGAPLNAAEQKSVVALWEQRLGGYQFSNTAVDSWISYRKKTVPAIKDPNISTDKGFSGKDSYFTYINCPANAFEFALKTAKQVSTEFGADSVEFKNWLTAQDDVFCNCSGYAEKPTIPAPVKSDLSNKMKPYRDYQTATANFYAGNFDIARQQFLAIAQDKGSPFKDLGAYLAVRALVRKANVAEKTDNLMLAAAEKEAKQLLTGESKNSLKDAVDDLIAFIQFKIHPKETFVQLTKELSKNAQGVRAGNNLCDYTYLFDMFVGESDSMSSDESSSPNKSKEENSKFIKESGDLSDWIFAFQKNAPSQHAVSCWQKSRSVPWLLAALSLCEPNEPAYGQLMEAANKVPRTSPAYQHLQYEIAVHLIKAGKREEARKVLELVLSDKTIELGPSSRNMFVSQRLVLCKDFSDFLRWTLQRPACIESGWDGIELPTEFAKMEASRTYTNLEPAFSDSTTQFLNAAVPMNLLLKLAELGGMPVRLKGDILQALWVRAFLLGDAKALAVLSSKLKQALPTLSSAIASFEKASSEEEKGFAGAFMVLRNPGMRPVITSGYGRRTPVGRIDDYQDNWWQKSDLSLPDKDPGYLACLSSSEKVDGATENKKIQSMGLAPAVLCKKVLAFAKSSPQDSRIPEALSLAVKATRFGERDSSTSKLSKECFVLLHNKYPKSPWTAKTKYFY